MKDCIFCKIAAGRLPAAMIFEEEQTLAFLDANPIAFGHTLVITREHYERLTDVPPEPLAALITATRRVAAAAVAGTGAEGFNLLQSNGACAAQVIPHVHFHVVPRRTGDGLHFVQRRETLTHEKRDAALDLIKARL